MAKKRDIIFRSMREVLEHFASKKEYPPEMRRKMKRSKYYRMGVGLAEEAIRQVEKLKENVESVRRRRRALGRDGRRGDLPKLSLAVA